MYNPTDKLQLTDLRCVYVNGNKYTTFKTFALVNNTWVYQSLERVTGHLVTYRGAYKKWLKGLNQ